MEVELLRRADLVDAFPGLLHFGLSRGWLDSLFRRIPRAGLYSMLFGSVLGFVIGKTVAAAHLDRYSSITVLPYYDPVCSASGLLFEKRF